MRGKGVGVSKLFRLFSWRKGRHTERRHTGADGLPVLKGIVVSKEREGRDSAWVVAVRAVGVNDAGNSVGPRGGVRG